MDARYYITFNDFLREGDQAAVYVHGGKFVAIIKFVGKYHKNHLIQVTNSPDVAISILICSCSTMVFRAS